MRFTPIQLDEPKQKALLMTLTKFINNTWLFCFVTLHCSGMVL